MKVKIQAQVIGGSQCGRIFSLEVEDGPDGLIVPRTVRIGPDVFEFETFTVEKECANYKVAVFDPKI